MSKDIVRGYSLPVGSLQCELFQYVLFCHYAGRLGFLGWK